VIFVDTSFWIASAAADDDRHQDASRLVTEYGREALATSNHVRGEVWTFMRRRYGHRPAVDLLKRLDRSSRLSFVFVSEELEAEALRWLRRHDERAYSFVDATSFALMRSLKIREALAFDGDFAAAGFTELRPS
jgi:predicted nucleic acid-binding protein